MRSQKKGKKRALKLRTAALCPCNQKNNIYQATLILCGLTDLMMIKSRNGMAFYTLRKK